MKRIRRSVVFHLAGNKGYSAAAEGPWRLEKLAADHESISLSPGREPKLCRDERPGGPSADATESHLSSFLKPQTFRSSDSADIDRVHWFTVVMMMKHFGFCGCHFCI